MARVVEAFYKVQKDRLHPRPYQVHDDSSEEDTFVLFSVLQDIANELRRIKHGKKYSQTRRPE
jgi:hypothetical protein